MIRLLKALIVNPFFRRYDAGVIPLRQCNVNNTIARNTLGVENW